MTTSRIVRAAADLAVTQPALVTVPNVQLLEVGEEWETSTGSFTFTPEDLVSCIQSQEDPSLRTPVVKLGHVDPRFDGQPSLGKIENMRLENNSQTLVGDLVAMPLWLAQIMYTAYPRRSIEGQFNFTTRTGNTWPLILTGVALLGDMYPAIDTLEDIQALWGSTPPPLYPVQDVEEITASGNLFRARKVTDMPKWLKKIEASSPTPVKAAIGLDAVRYAFYESLSPGQEWWWIREVRVNPLSLIVDDDQMHLWEVPVTISGTNEITFGEPSGVKVEYIAASGAPITPALPGQVVAATHDTPEESGRTSRTDPEGEATVLPEATTTTEETHLMLTEEALAALGLSPDATSEQISAAILAQQVAAQAAATEPETPQVETAELVVPEGMALVDAATLQELRNGVAAANGLVERQAKADRDSLLDTAIRAGKFPLGRRGHYETMLSADPAGGKAIIDSLSPGLVPVAEVGTENDVAASAAPTAYPSGWQRTIEAGRKSFGDRVKVIQD